MPKLGLHRLPPEDLSLDDLVAQIRALPLPPPQDLLKLKSAIHRNQLPVKSLTVSSDGKPSPRLPMWVIGYWETLEILEEDIRWWLKAKAQLETDGNDVTLRILETIPWDGKIPAGIVCRVRDLAALVTNTWLTGTQLDMLGQYFNAQVPTTKRILRTTDGQALIHRYRSGKPTKRFHTPTFLRKIGTELQVGNLVQVGLCVNVNMGRPSKLPGNSDTGNHWVALVVDIQEQTLYFGDAEGCAAPIELLAATRSWLREYFDQDFIRSDLRCTKQPTSWCCGDLAMNMIAHHFDNKISLASSNPVGVEEYRRSTFQELVHLIRTLVSFHS